MFYLDNVLKDYEVSHVEAYTLSHMERKSFSKMLNGESPTKRMIYMLAFGLEMFYSDVRKLMQAAGRTFQPGSATDQVVKYHLMNGFYDIDILKRDLEENGAQQVFPDWVYE